MMAPTHVRTEPERDEHAQTPCPFGLLLRYSHVAHMYTDFSIFHDTTVLYCL